MNHSREHADDHHGFGRHRHGAAGTWTPTVSARTTPRRDEPGRHEPGRHEPGPTVPAQRPAEPDGHSNTDGHIAGVLPGEYASRTSSSPSAVPRQRSTAGRADDTRTAAPEQVSSQGGGQGGGQNSARAPLQGSGQGSGQRRRRVNLTQPERPPVSPPGRADETESAEWDQAHTGGLGMFNLGSVPASVTPPRTWRKAAWFAAASSGSVMGLLFAGTFLLGQQPDEPQAAEEWSYVNRRGGAPALEREGLLAPTADPTSSGVQRHDSTVTGADDVATSATSRSTGPSRSDGPPAPGRSTSDSASPTSTDDGPGSPTTSTRTTTAPPQKPSPTPAEVVVVNERALYENQLDVDAMARDTQNFYNSVTEDPARARQLTAGELHDKGAAGLSRMYSEVAYFEVEKVVVNEGESRTRNTMRVVYNDGEAEMAKRTLSFDNDGKITAVGR